jgi:hypothetical protein
MLLVAIVFGCSFTANRAEAQALYYRSIPLGERAMGLGGAYTGIANDPSATYYNPAGIVTGGRFQLMGSLSSLVFTRRTIDDAFDATNLNADFTSTRTTTIPSFVGTVVKLGRKRFGDHQWAIAYSTFEVGRESFGVGVSEIEAPASLDLRLNNTYKSRWYGISFAAHAAKKVAVGLSGFLADQSGRYDEDIGLASGGTFNESGLRIGGKRLRAPKSGCQRITSSSEWACSIESTRAGRWGTWSSRLVFPRARRAACFGAPPRR